MHAIGVGLTYTVGINIAEIEVNVTVFRQSLEASGG